MVKDSSFIGWRYGGPEIEYKVISIEKHEQVVALAFVRKAVLKNVLTLSIVDVLVEASDTYARNTLFFEIEKIARDCQCELIGLMIRAIHAKLLGLFRLGYLRTPLVFQLITRPLSEKANQAPQISADTFDPMWVDCDNL